MQRLVIHVKDHAGFTRNDLTAFLETNRIETRIVVGIIGRLTE